jgi:glycosyltransferase involved in cell wall biosynthesis
VADAPEVTAVVPTHARPLRLLYLLDALAAQTLDRGRWEVVIVHSGDPLTARVLENHGLVRDGTARTIVAGPEAPSPAAKRNLGWRDAKAPLVAFTDDDCRPDPGWLEAYVDAAGANGGAVLQGRTVADPAEANLLDVNPDARTLVVEPPTEWGQTANMAYPREVLERVGGFDEGFPGPGGEDADLLIRARESGSPHVPVEEAVNRHAVFDLDFPARVRNARRWAGVVYLAKLQPQTREHAVLGIFWRERHAWFALALAGVLLSGWRRVFVLLALPYVVLTRPQGADDAAARVNALRLLPATAAIDAVEILTLAQASAKHRTLLL